MQKKVRNLDLRKIILNFQVFKSQKNTIFVPSTTYYIENSFENAEQKALLICLFRLITEKCRF